MHATRAWRSRWASSVALTFAAVLTFASATFAASVSPSPSQDQACDTSGTIRCTANGIYPQVGFVNFTLTASTVNDVQQSVPASIDTGSIKIQGSAASGRSESVKFDVVKGADAANSELMLLLDISQSMRKTNKHLDRFGPEIAAARSFVKGVKGLGLSVGIVTIGSEAKLDLPPTPELTTVLSHISTIEKTGPIAEKTDLYGAVTLAVKNMAETSSRSVLMITDGTYDPAKNLSPQQKAEKRSEAKTSLAGITGKTQNTVVFRGVLVGDAPGDDINALGEVSKLSDTSSLQQDLIAFAQSVSAQQAAKIDVKAQLPPSWAGKDIHLDVAASTSGGAAFATTVDFGAKKAGTAASTSAAGPVLRPASPDTNIPKGVLFASLIAVFAALAILLTSATGALAGADNKKSAVIRRLELYTVTGGKPARVEVTEQTTRLGDSALTRSAVNLMTRFARKSRMDDALDGQLEAAGLPLRTAEWMLLHIGIAVFGALLLAVLSGGQIAAGVVGLLLGIAGPWIFLTIARSRRESKFLAQLPDTLQLLAGSLAAGYSLPQAMDSVVRESHPPISMEFNRALVEARLGMLAEDALDGIAKRTGSTDFSWIVMAIRIQRDVGGNLAELLSSVADTLRERERLRRQVDALSAEGRLSGAILGALPLVFGLYLMLTRPTYIAPLFDTNLGLLLLAVGGVMLIVGGFWMSRVIKVKV